MYGTYHDYSGNAEIAYYVLHGAIWILLAVGGIFAAWFRAVRDSHAIDAVSFGFLLNEGDRLSSFLKDRMSGPKLDTPAARAGFLADLADVIGASDVINSYSIYFAFHMQPDEMRAFAEKCDDGHDVALFQAGALPAASSESSSGSYLEFGAGERNRAIASLTVTVKPEPFSNAGGDASPGIGLFRAWSAAGFPGLVDLFLSSAAEPAPSDFSRPGSALFQNLRKYDADVKATGGPVKLVWGQK